MHLQWGGCKGGSQSSCPSRQSCSKGHSWFSISWFTWQSQRFVLLVGIVVGGFSLFVVVNWVLFLGWWNMMKPPAVTRARFVGAWPRLKLIPNLDGHNSSSSHFFPRFFWCWTATSWNNSSIFGGSQWAKPQAAPKAAGTGAVAAKVLRDTKAMTKAWEIYPTELFLSMAFGLPTEMFLLMVGLEPARHWALTYKMFQEQ